MTTPKTTRPSLTDHDRRIIAEARQLARLKGSEAIRAVLTPKGIIKPGDDDAMVYPIAYGNAQVVLAELAEIASRLGGEPC